MLLTKELIEQAIKLFDRLSAFDAVDALCSVFKATTAVVLYNHEQLQVCDLYEFPELYQEFRAKDLEIGFFGGPPNKCVQRYGTLLTLFLDHLFYCYAMDREATLIKALKYAKV